MADVRINLKIDDAGALAQIKQFNESFKQIKVNANKASSSLNKIAKSTTVVNTQFGRLNSTMTKGTSKINKGFKKTRDELSGVARAGATIKNVFAGVFIADTLRAGIRALKDSVIGSIKTFADFETGLVSVGKTANITGKELTALGKDILDMDIPIGNDRLLELAKTAGQLGIKGSSNILKFTETMAKLEVATDIAGEEGASAMARILNITNEATDTVDVFGSVIVALGNNFAATESEILRVTSEVARATAQFGVSSTEAAALGAAIKSLGGRAEGGGTAIGKLFRKLNEGVELGGPLLTDFAEIMGVSEQALTDMFKSNPTKAVVDFLEAMKKAKTEGTSMSAILTRIGLNTDRVSKVLPVLATRVDEVKRAYSTANAETENTVALNKEAAAAFDTLNSDYDKMVKDIKSLATDLVSNISPELRSVLQSLADMARVLRGNITGDSSARIKILTENINELKQELFDTKDDKLKADFLRSQIKRTEQLRDSLDSVANIERRRREEAAAAKGEMPQPAGVAGPTGPSLEDEKAALEAKKAQRDIFRELDKEDEKAHNDGLEFISTEWNTRQIENIRTAFDTDRALDIASKADALIREGKFEKAKALIRKADLEADKKLADDKKKVDAEISRNKKDALNTIVSLSSSNNKTLAGIGKAFALYQLSVDAPVAIGKAFAAFPPPINFVAAAAVGAAMAAQTAKVVGANFEQGGIVPGSSFSGDNVQANVNSGEMILNRQQQSNLFNMAKQGGGQGQQEIVVNTSVQVGEEEIARAVSRQVANGFQLGEQT